MVPEQRLKPLCKQAGPGTHCDPEFAFLLQYQLKHRISSVGRDPKGSTSSSSWACTRQSQKSHHVSERIVQALLISGRCCDQAVRKALRNTRQQVVNGHQNRFSCLFYLSQVLLAQGSARRGIWQTPLCSQATSCQTPSYPLQKHRQLDSHLSFALQAAEKVFPKFLWNCTFLLERQGVRSTPQALGCRILDPGLVPLDAAGAIIVPDPQNQSIHEQNKLNKPQGC